MLYKAKVKESREGRVLIEAADYNEAVAAFNNLEPEDIYWDEEEPVLTVSAMVEEKPGKSFHVYMTKTTKLTGELYCIAESEEDALAKAETLYRRTLTEGEAKPNEPCFAWVPHVEEVSFSAKELKEGSPPNNEDEEDYVSELEKEEVTFLPFGDA